MWLNASTGVPCYWALRKQHLLWKCLGDKNIYRTLKPNWWDTEELLKAELQVWRKSLGRRRVRDVFSHHWNFSNTKMNPSSQNIIQTLCSLQYNISSIPSSSTARCIVKLFWDSMSDMYFCYKKHSRDCAEVQWVSSLFLDSWKSDLQVLRKIEVKCGILWLFPKDLLKKSCIYFSQSG